MRRIAAFLLLSSSCLLAQTPASNDPQPEIKPLAHRSNLAEADDSAQQQQQQEQSAAQKLVVPRGTKVLLALKSGINTKSAKPGNGVYLVTTFPVAINNQIAIPAGTYVQGVIDSVKRSGRVKGRAEVLFHFTTLIFPNGYTVNIPGALEDVPGADSGKVKDQEGTVQADGTKGRDAGTIAGPAATGGLIGAAAAGGKGAAYGGLAGAAAGLATVLFTRGDDVRLEQGTAVEMVLQRPLELEPRQVAGNRNTEYFPVENDRRLKPAPKPSRTLGRIVPIPVPIPTPIPQ